MPTWKRASLLLGALLCMTGAAALVIGVGLPERALFTGRLIPGERPIAPEIDALAPPFTARTLDGETVDLLALRGHPVIINFWATWCAPCRLEMPDLQALYEVNQARGLRLLAINLGEPPNVIRPWVDSFGLTFDILLDESQSLAALYYLRGQPSTYVVSPQGIITQIYFGQTSKTTLEAAISPYLS